MPILPSFLLLSFFAAYKGLFYEAQTSPDDP
jgi:hypothetical protein